MSNEKKKIRKKLLGFDVGMTYYSTLEEDEEDITIPFVESLYITSNKIVELLPEYLECLKRNECPEVLGIDLDVMTNTAYWMKNDKLQHDMEALNDLTLHERGIEFAYKGFKPATTLELYEAIRKNVEDMVRMLSDVRRLLIAAPPALYGNFYRQQKSQYDEQKTEAAYEQWKREVGVVTFDILVDKQALEVAEFLKRKILRFSQMPSKREIDRVDINKLKEHLPIGYELPEEFPKCYARFMRFATLDGDILSINANSYGKYLHQFYHRLSDDEQQVLIGLDLMLQRIHRDMKAYPQPLPKGREKESGGQSNVTSETPTKQICHCISLLMAERIGDEPLFNLQGHWQAVYRILVDKGYCRDSDFDGFDAFIRTVMPEKVNRPYKKDSVKQISQTDFVKPFNEWVFDMQTSKTRKPFDRMTAIAQRFLEILEENGL